jgi:hypothetical protein
MRGGEVVIPIQVNVFVIAGGKLIIPVAKTIREREDRTQEARTC